VRAADLAAGLDLLRGGDVAFAFAVTTYAFPIFRSFRLNDDGSVAMFFPENFATRSQDLPEAFHDAGQFYWARPQTWLSGEAVFGARSRVVPIPRWRVQDIDTAEDWTRAEIIWRMLEAQPSADR
jgi:N-acylneuraminate cytidylyltransferase